MSALAGERIVNSDNETCDQGVEVTPDAHEHAHVVALTVWDVPPATAVGERFAVSIGAKCSAGCDLGGRALNLYDQKGLCVATVKLGHDVCAGTEALYFAQVEVSAPLEAGSHPWEAKIAGWEAEATHAAGSFPLMIRVVPTPDREVTVKAVAKDKQTPIAGARVVMHPYRAVTDDDGIAKIKVARGQYDILVSRSLYLPTCVGAEVNFNMMTTVELGADQPWTSPDEDLT